MVLCFLFYSEGEVSNKEKPIEWEIEKKKIKKYRENIEGKVFIW